MVPESSYQPNINNFKRSKHDCFWSFLFALSVICFFSFFAERSVVAMDFVKDGLKDAGDSVARVVGSIAGL